MRTEIVTTLKREATRILSELHQTREPILITEHGRPSAYLVDAEDYDSLQNRLQILEGLAKGERAYRDQNIMTHHEAKKKFSKWLQ